MAFVFVRVIAASAALAVSGVACSGRPSTAPKPFCQSAFDYEAELQRELTKGTVDAPKQIALFRRIVATAPATVHADAQRFLDALEQVQADPRIRNDRSVTEPAHRAVDRVNRYASNRCGLFNQQRGNGI
jgi:hypothetical protein